MSIEEEMLLQFFSEAHDLLDDLEETLINCEKDGIDQDKIDHMMRILHTLKGSSALVKLEGISKFVHKTETFIRDQDISALGQPFIDQLLDPCDLVAGGHLRAEHPKFHEPLLGRYEPAELAHGNRVDFVRRKVQEHR